MIKAIAFLTRKPGMSREAFIEYYEQRHVPLILSLFPETCGYRRNYLQHETAVLYPGEAGVQCDAVSEFWYPDRGAYEAAMRRFAEPGVAERIAEDEEQVFDRSKTRFVLVDERVSDLG